MEEQYDGLRQKLAEQSFPITYMYKFIALEDKVSELKPYFEDAEIKTKASSKGKYVSFTAVEVAISPEQIIDKYKSLAHIKGLISL